MTRNVLVVFALALAAGYALARFSGSGSSPSPAPSPTPAPSTAAPAPPAPAPDAVAMAGEELPGGLVERAQALLTGRRPPGASGTSVTSGSSPGTLLVTAHAREDVDPVDAWRRPLHELRELFTRLPGLEGVEYALQAGAARKATLRLDRPVVERMRLVQQLDQMHGKRELLLQQRAGGTLDDAGYTRQLRELERVTFSDLLVMIPADRRDIAPELRIAP